MAKNDKPAAAKADGTGTSQAPTGQNDGIASAQSALNTPGLAATSMPDAAGQNTNSGAAGDDTNLSLEAYQYDQRVETVRAVEVVANRDGYRRAGRGWGTVPTVIRSSDLTEEQFGLLMADKNIKLRPVEIAADQEASE